MEFRTRKRRWRRSPSEVTFNLIRLPDRPRSSRRSKCPWASEGDGFVDRPEHSAGRPDLSVKKPIRDGGHVLLVVLFVVYLVLLAWAVVWKLERLCRSGRAAPAPDQADPVRAQCRGRWQRAPRGHREPPAFVPFSLYLGLLAPTWQWWRWTGVLVGASLVLEATQHLLSTGSFDTTDIIVNTARRPRRGRAARLGTPESPGKDRRRHDQGLPGRDGGVAARGRDLRRLAAALPAAAGVIFSTPAPSR